MFSFVRSALRRLLYAITGMGGAKPTPEHDRATVFIDTETGGFDALSPDGLKHEIIEVSMIIERRRKVAHRLTVKVKPEREVAPGAAEKNGYTPEGWADALTKAEAVKLMQRTWWKHACTKYKVPEFTDRAGKVKDYRWLFPHVVAQNVRFDLHHLDTLTQTEADSTLPMAGVIDTLVMAKALNSPSHSMDFLRRWLGWSSEGAHTAEVDTVQLRKLYHFMQDAGPLRLFVAGVLGRWRTAVDEVPEAHG